MLPEYLHAVCFDIGGVLVRLPRGFLAEELANVLRVDAEVVRHLLIEHGKRRPRPSHDLAVVLATACGSPAEADRVEVILRQRHCDMANPVLYEDVLPVLSELRTGGWRVCFLSNTTADMTARPRLSYLSFAEVVLHSCEIGYCKPETHAFRTVEQRMGLAPHELVMVGDSMRADVLGALNAGWSAVHLRRDSAPPTAPQSVPSISSLAELLTLLRPPTETHVNTGATDDIAR